MTGECSFSVAGGWTSTLGEESLVTVDDCAPPAMDGMGDEGVGDDLGIHMYAPYKSQSYM